MLKVCDMNEYYEILIASLLHDIGKFKERAFWGEEHSAFPESMEGIILPHTEDGRYTHRHALWTYDFFENDLNTWNLPQGIDWKKVKDLASKHHNATGGDEEIIQRADRISAASDRSGEAGYEKGAHLKRPLKPVFSAIELDHRLSAEYGYKLSGISAEFIFPLKMKGIVVRFKISTESSGVNFCSRESRLSKNIVRRRASISLLCCSFRFCKSTAGAFPLRRMTSFAISRSTITQ